MFFFFLFNYLCAQTFLNFFLFRVSFLILENFKKKKKNFNYLIYSIKLILRRFSIFEKLKKIEFMKFIYLQTAFFKFFFLIQSGKSNKRILEIEFEQNNNYIKLFFFKSGRKLKKLKILKKIIKLLIHYLGFSFSDKKNFQVILLYINSYYYSRIHCFYINNKKFDQLQKFNLNFFFLDFINFLDKIQKKINFNQF
jgi:hypothetical protein